MSTHRSFSPQFRLQVVRASRQWGDVSGTHLPRVPARPTGGRALEGSVPAAGRTGLSHPSGDRRRAERAEAARRTGAAVRTAQPGERVVKKSLGQGPPAGASRHAVITQTRAQGAGLSVRHMCEVLQVNRAWYYAQQQPAPAPTPSADEPAICQALHELAKEFSRSGYRRMTAALKRMG